MLSINPSSMSRGKRVFSMYWSGHAIMLNPPFSGWSWLNGLLMSSSRNSRVSIPIFLLTYLYFSHARSMNISLNLCISVDHISLVDGCKVLPKLSIYQLYIPFTFSTFFFYFQSDNGFFSNAGLWYYYTPTYSAGKKMPIENVVQQQPSQEKKRQQQPVVDVHGGTSEPICTYHGCDHKFSVHGLGNCKCKHPSNTTLGVFNKYL
jgi:hypothetical protein